MTDVTVFIDKDWYEEKLESIEENDDLDISEEKEGIHIQQSIEPGEMIINKGSLSISGVADLGFVELAIPLTPARMEKIMTDFSEIVSDLSGGPVKKTAKKSGTGAIVYVPKEWEGEEVIVSRKPEGD